MLKTIDRLDEFPLTKQRDTFWCIPASIEAVIRYHGYDGDIDQTRIVQIFEQNVGSITGINFDLISTFLNKCLLNDRFGFETIEKSEFREWLDVVRINVNQNQPPLISIKNPHIVVVVGYGDHSLGIHDPDYNKPSRIEELTLGQIESSRNYDILVVRPKSI